MKTLVKKKPEIITFYNITKGGVDTCDQLCSNYNVGRRTKKWPLAIFNHFINVLHWMHTLFSKVTQKKQ